MIRFLIVSCLLASHTFAAETSRASVVSKSKSLPPKEGVWHGDSPHLFYGGQAMLFCGSHGTFSGQSTPPEQRGEVKTIAYRAIFKGELKLKPPLSREPRTIDLNEPIRMTERVISNGNRGNAQNFKTELMTVTFRGSSLPSNISIRESPRRRSMGTASIAPGPRGTHSIRSVYEVWLEISVDGGKTWRLADNAVTMSLMPDIKQARPVSAPKRQSTKSEPPERSPTIRRR